MTLFQPRAGWAGLSLVFLALLVFHSLGFGQELSEEAQRALEKELGELRIQDQRDREREKATRELAEEEKKTKEPAGFAGLRWGASPQEMSRFFDARETRSGKREKRFQAGYRIGAVPVTVDFFFLDNRLVHVTLSFEPTYSQDVEAAFRERYGKPTADAGGAQFWLSKNVKVVLAHFFPRETVAFFSTKEYLDYAEQREKKKGKAAAKNR